MICRYWFFNHEFKFQDYVRNGCHDLTILSVNVGNTAIITDKNLIIVVMVDIEYSMDIYMSLNNNIGEVMKNTEKLKFASDHLKLRKICKHPIKE